MYREIREEEEIKDLTKKYLLNIPLEDKLYECEDFFELTAAICGGDYIDAQWAETRWHLRRETAGNIGLFCITAMESKMGFPDDDDFEPIIIYDVRIGKIPYNYTDPVVDYDIHGEPKPIHIESDKAFVYSLLKLGVIQVCEIQGEELKSLTQLYNIGELLEKELKQFRELNQERVPLHKMFGE